MRLEDFCHYSHRRRADLVRTQGIFLAARIEKDSLLHLYYMRDFFAEIWTHDTDIQREFVRPFRGGCLLEPYIEMVNLSEIAS